MALLAKEPTLTLCGSASLERGEKESTGAGLTALGGSRRWARLELQLQEQQWERDPHTELPGVLWHSTAAQPESLAELSPARAQQQGQPKDAAGAPGFGEGMDRGKG